MQRSHHSRDFAVTVSQLTAFDELLDVRSPAEFAADHIIGAINLPVLTNEQRAEVGSEYKQISAFAAKRKGAAYVARNIAQHLEQSLSEKPKNWRPLIYCWRGGTRSGAMVDIFRKIGWQAAQLAGGYKAYRQHVNLSLSQLPQGFSFKVIAGPTGSGKSPLLLALAEQGFQVLDLEALACHRGSVLGDLPATPQPTQKFFESLIWHRLSLFDPSLPVFIEAESQKIGRLRVPVQLLEQLRRGQCISLSVPLAARVAYLKETYQHFLTDPSLLSAKLTHLARLKSASTIARWQTFALTQQWDLLVAELLHLHYDPGYEKSTHSHFSEFAAGLTISLSSLNTAGVQQAVREIASLIPNSSAR